VEFCVRGVFVELVLLVYVWVEVCVRGVFVVDVVVL